MTLRDQFESAIRDVITRTLKETSYKPTYFMQMVSDNGAYDASLRLIRKSQPSDGFTKLWELKRLDLTVEAVATQPEYSSLFSEEDVEKAQKRLSQYGYEVRGSKPC